ncbi:sensor histidine kinase, partial [Saccharothrix sp. MB29]|nr:sensor histidine kinase [Saccharothrix sp. MB29]
LAIVKHVANNHGGEVKLWSLPGTGSTFTLRVPAHPDPDEPTKDQAAGDHDRRALATPVPSGAGGNDGGEL